MDYKVDPPDDVWVDYALPWIEGRCIPEKRLQFDGDRWIMQYRYPKPDTDEMDREKVIKGIQECDLNGGLIGNCPYKDILFLLEEQEAVEPRIEPSAKGYWYTCGACGWWLFEVRDSVHFDDRKRIRFCASCGRSVKWDA